MKAILTRLVILIIIIPLVGIALTGLILWFIISPFIWVVTGIPYDDIIEGYLLFWIELFEKYDFTK